MSILLACLLGAMVNFFIRASFASATSIALASLFSVVVVIVYWLPEYSDGYQWGKHIGYSKNLICAIILLMPAIVTMGTVATSLSVYLSQMANMICCGTIFFWGLISDYVYYRIIDLSREKLIQVMVFWPCYLIPLVLIFWYVSLRSVYKRRQNPTLYNFLYGTTTLSLVIWGVYGKITRAELRPPTVITKLLANATYFCKNFISEIFHATIPNWQLFWMADTLTAGKTISGTYVGFGFVYTFCFTLVFTCIAVLLFNYREVGQQMPRWQIRTKSDRVAGFVCIRCCHVNKKLYF